MKKFGLFAICAALFLALALSGCAAKAPGEKLYVLSRERDAVYLVGVKGSEKVMDVPADALLADVSGSSLWYATETSLVKLCLADGSRTEYDLPEDEYKSELLAFEAEAYIRLNANAGAGKVLRADEDGLTRVTGKTVYDRVPHVPFAVENGAIYYFSTGAPLWREDAEGRTHLDIVRSPLYGMSVDRGRVFLCGAEGCFSYDAATGTDERLELEFSSVDASELPRAVYSFEIIKTAAAHDGWLYWPAANPKAKGADDAVLLMAKRLSDGLTVEYAKVADVFGYSFDSVVTFGRQGLVVSDGCESETFRYIPYYSETKSALKNQLGLPDASSVTVIGGNLSGAEGRRAYVTATDEIDNMLIGLKYASWRRGKAVAGAPADYLCRLDFGGGTVYIIGPSDIAWDGSFWHTRSTLDLAPFERFFRDLPDKGDPLPPLPEARVCRMEDTFVISRDGDDLVISSAGSGATRRQVAETYLYDLKNDYPDFVDGPVPPIGGDIRFGMSYAEVMERIEGMPFTGEPDINLVFESDLFNSYAGELCRMKFEFTRRYGGGGDGTQLSQITLIFDEGYEAETWFELYRRFTEAFGRPASAGSTGSFRTVDELRGLLEDWLINPNVQWEPSNGTGLVLAIGGSGYGRHNVVVVMTWSGPGSDPSDPTAPTPDATPVPTPTPYNPDFERWEWDESTSSVETVRSIFRHMNELRGITSCEAVSVEYDEELTKINREALAGSDLAKSREVSDERIMNDLEIVRAVYDIVYDDSVPHMMGSGRYEVIFHMLRDGDTGFWDVWDHSSPADVPAPDPIELPADIEKAILDRAEEEATGFSHGDFSCAALRAFGTETSGNTTKVYAYVCWGAYSLVDGEIKTVGGYGGPCAATVEKGADGVCRVTESVQAGMRGGYEHDIETSFPQELRIWAYKSQIYAADAGAESFAKAEAYFASAGAELTEDWQNAYADYVDRRINDYEAGRSTNVLALDLKDFSGDGIPELLLYTEGGGVSEALEIYVWEDGELRAFCKDCANGLPTAANAVPAGFSTIPGTAREDRRYGGLRLFDDGWLLEAHGGDPLGSYYAWYRPGADARGRLVLDELISWEISGGVSPGDDETGWTLNGRSVTRDELHSTVDAFLLDLEGKTEYYVRWDGADRRRRDAPGGLTDLETFASDFRRLLASWEPGAPVVSTGMRGPTLAEDFTVRGVKWGAAYDEVKAQIGDAEELENGMRLSKKGAEFFGQKADIDYVFAKVDGKARLNAVAVVFEPDFDKEAVAAAITAVLGEIDKYAHSSSGDVIPVEEPLWNWHDDEKVGMKFMHTAHFGEYLYPGDRPILEIIYNGLWS